MRNRSNDEDELAAARRELAAREPAHRRYEREVKAIQVEYDRAVAPALKCYQDAVALVHQEMSDAYAKASIQKREQMLREYEEKRERLWNVFVRETDAQRAKRDRELAAASIRYNS